jgi:hypothetical protein
VSERSKPQSPRLQDVHAQVEADYMDAQREAQKERALARLRARYTIVRDEGA